MRVEGTHTTCKNSPSDRHPKYDEGGTCQLFMWRMGNETSERGRGFLFSVFLRFPNQEIGDRAFRSFGVAKALDSLSFRSFRKKLTISSTSLDFDWYSLSLFADKKLFFALLALGNTNLITLYLKKYSLCGFMVKEKIIVNFIYA